MQQLLPPSIFIKANFTFSINDREFSYLNQGVSVFGISGLRWAHFDPADRVGEKIKITVDVLAKNKFRFVTSARLTAESTIDASYLGMKFDLNDIERERLAAVIQKEGFCPPNYVRKYPRIPALPAIPAMPLRAIVRDESDTMLSFDIANMSPGGILLHTENPRAAFFQPGNRIFSQVEPRADMFHGFEFEGVICRVVLDKAPPDGNVTRYFGVKFSRIPKEQKETFLYLLKMVIESIQKKNRSLK